MEQNEAQIRINLAGNILAALSVTGGYPDPNELVQDSISLADKLLNAMRPASIPLKPFKRPQTKNKQAQKYHAVVHLLIEADSDAEASDAISEALTHTLKANGALVDWQYAINGANKAPYPKPISEEKAREHFVEYGDSYTEGY